MAKAREAFLANQARQRFWTWTAIASRSILDKQDRVLQTFPTVTIESPIRSDGKRCNAVLAWSDGVAPYLATATADERCTVDEETPDTLHLDELLRSRQVKIKSRSAAAITLVITEDKSLANAPDLLQKCAASLRATVELDPATFFPVRFEINVPGHNCEQTSTTTANHYDDTPIRRATAGPFKDSTLRFEYELQKDRAGDRSKDYWICKHRSNIRPLGGAPSGMIVSGRLFSMKGGPDRRLVVDTKTTAAELATESMIKFETEKPL